MMQISGSEIRKKLLSKDKIPQYLLNSSLYKFIKDRINEDKDTVFEK